MIIISAQPDEDYFLWQLKVQISNMIKIGMDAFEYHILVRYSGATPRFSFLELQQELEGTNFKLFFYKDSRRDFKQYISSLRPHILAQHFDRFKIDECFYIDADVIFRECPNFSILQGGSYCSDTISYIGAEYIHRKDPTRKLLQGMCEIVGIEATYVEAQQANSGGAQYLIRGVDAEFWKKVEKDCVNLYLYMYGYNSENFNNQQLGIQAWCADMWAVLWNLWLRGECKVDKELDFCWPTQNTSYWDKVKIYHNAGVTAAERHRLFFKADYMNKSPFEFDFSYVEENKCSIYYTNEIKTCILQKNK